MDTNDSSNHNPIEAPSGLDLHPQPQKLCASAAGLAWHRLRDRAIAAGIRLRRISPNAQNQAAARDAGLPRTVLQPPKPERNSCRQLRQERADDSASSRRAHLQMFLSHAAQIRRPASRIGTIRRPVSPATAFPRSESSSGRERDTAQPIAPDQSRRDTRRAPSRLAYQREQEAILAPTGIRKSAVSSLSATPAHSTSIGLSQVEAVSHILGARQGGDSAPLPNGQAVENDYDTQNMQSRKEAFLAAGGRQTDDYLRSIRAAPMSRYEIKAGWEIPAVLEQCINSDLPGELKALVTSNVYDTATGIYLLIPQGSRLIGQYDSRVSYGQDGVQVAWSRIIYPDASSVDLNGMVGLDSHGNAGLRDKVDRHYRRMVGFSVLTSMFTAAFESPSNEPERSEYPRPGQTDGSRRTGTKSDGCSDHPPQSERTANHQGPCRVQIHGALKPRHPL